MAYILNNKKGVLGGRYGIVVLVGVVCLLFSGIWQYQLRQGREHAISSAENNTSNLVRIIEEANIRTLQSIDLTLINVATCVQSKKWSGGEEQKRYLRKLLDEAPQIREVAFADASGEIVASSRRGLEDGLSIRDEIYFDMALRGVLPPLYVSGPRPGRILGDDAHSARYHIVMARSVVSELGKFQGVALAVINPGYFQEQFYGLDVGEMGYVALYRYDGKLLVASSPDTLDPETLHKNNAVIFDTYLPDKEWGTFLQQWQTGAGSYLQSYRATSRWPVLVVVGVQQREVLSGWRQEAMDFSLLMGCSMLLLIGLAVVVFRQHVAQEELARKLFEAHHDDLTGVPSLRLTLDRLSIALARARRNRDILGVFFVDLDGFKEVNDTYGHEAGDFVLQTVAGQLRGCVREMDTVGRLGGDEFLIIFPKLTETASVDKMAASVLKAVSEPVVWGGRKLQVSASVGVALHPRDGKHPESLIKKADAAMYKAKKQGKNQFVLASGA